MSSPIYHKERLRQDLAREIGWAIANRMRDPRIPHLVTVTEVRLSDDTRNATVMVSVYGARDEQEDAIEVLNGAAPFIQKVVSEHVSMRNFPKMYFKLDTSLDRSQRISELLNEVKDDLVGP